MYIAQSPEDRAGHVVGNGQCVAFVIVAADAPHTSLWRRGMRVKGTRLFPGTAIASFDFEGNYGNHTDHSSHAAIYISQDAHGIYVWDQWVGHPVSHRLIHFQPVGHFVHPVNDGGAYSVIE